jgi:hypothetical protein
MNMLRNLCVIFLINLKLLFPSSQRECKVDLTLYIRGFNCRRLTCVSKRIYFLSVSVFCAEAYNRNKADNKSKALLPVSTRQHIQISTHEYVLHHE